MRILALDLGTRTGWALWDGTRRESGVQTFDVKRGESPGMRYLRFNRWLDDVARVPWTRAPDPYRDQVVDLVVYEQTLARFARGQGQTEIAVNLAGRVQEFCARYEIQHAAVWPATLKKWTTGKGNAKKPAVVAAVNERFGPPFVTDDNEADAIALLEYARAELVPDASSRGSGTLQREEVREG